MDNYTTTTLAGLVTTPASVTEYSLDSSAPFPTVFKIDATYDPTSENAQSGVAVAEALKTVVIPVDATYNATSANPQAGTAVAQALDTLSVQWDATKGSIRMGTTGGAPPVANNTVEIGTGSNNTNSTNSVAIGNLARCREGSYGVAIGYNSVAVSSYSSALGSGTWAAKNSIGIGKSAQARVANTVAIGSNVTVNDSGATCLSTFDSADTQQTLLYLIGAGSSLATTYEDGEACLGYVVKDTAGNILACGTRKLSELLTNNTNFTPTSLDPDAPEPTPFLPTGITEPIVFEEPEELIPTDQPTE